MNETAGKNSKLILAAMIFAVSMTFIDQTIVAISLPTIQGDVHLSTTGSQWIINGYLLSLSALFAFGGRLADIAGHRRMVIIGVIVFAVSSALCGATPTGSGAEAWLIVFRIIQGAGAAIMFPAALAIVLDSFPVAERGRAMAIFFGIAGGGTLIRPHPGGHPDRPDRGRLPHRVDLALDLLDQRPGRDHRPLPPLAGEARRHPPPGED